MIKAAIFDLDSTLINTYRIKEKIFDFVKKASGGDNDFALKIYDAVRSKNDRMIFSLDILEKELRKEIAAFDEKSWDEFVESFNCLHKDLLIDGALELLKYFKENNVPVYILTLGVDEWQKNKIKMCGLDGFFNSKLNNFKYTTEEDSKKGKIKAIKEILEELNLENCNDMLFLNDRPDETEDILKEFPALKVFIRREKKDKRHTDDDFLKLSKNKNIIKISDDLNILDSVKKFI